jgi:hypothetical protein
MGSTSLAADETVLDAVNAPISVSRSKKPFPFSCVQLIKKKISNPPPTGKNLAFNGYLNPSPECGSMLYYEESCFLFVHPRELNAVALPPLPPNWYTHKDQTNVFHPPPVAV